jgi:hypothetical protein
MGSCVRYVLIAVLLVTLCTSTWASKVVDLAATDFDATLAAKDIVLIAFVAPWWFVFVCLPCDVV